MAKDAPAGALKAKYHALQRNYHPDAFFWSPDDELRQAVNAIAKRVAEAYVILRDPEKRAKYTRDISGPERHQKLRYTDETAHEQRLENRNNSAVQRKVVSCGEKRSTPFGAETPPARSAT